MVIGALSHNLMILFINMRIVMIFSLLKDVGITLRKHIYIKFKQFSEVKDKLRIKIMNIFNNMVLHDDNNVLSGTRGRM